jgi:hypothetical protein
MKSASSRVLVSEPERATLAVALQAVKQSVARQLIGKRKHFWQARYYDFKCLDEDEAD